MTFLQYPSRLQPEIAPARPASYPIFSTRIAV
jgi:hypothetical protein